MSEVHLNAITSLLPSTHPDSSDPNLILASCVDRYLTIVDDTDLKLQLSGKEVYEAHYLCCLDYLQRCIRYADSESDVLFSVSREQQLRKCLEFVVCLGLYPLLDDGVSIPLEMRLTSAMDYRCPKRSNDPERQQKLLAIAQCLSQLRNSSSDQLRRLLSPTLFLGDLIAALVQLAYGPSSPSSDCCSSINQSLSDANVEGRKSLWNLLCDLPGHVAMKELLILQGGVQDRVKVKGAVKLPVAPFWLRKSCGRLLSRLLSRTRTGPDGKAVGKGVKDLLLAAASLAPGIISTSSPASVINSLDPRLQPALAGALARILVSSPASLPAKSSETAISQYHSMIAAQVHELIKFDTDLNSASSSDSLSQFGQFLAFTTVHEMCSRNPDLGKQLYLEPLIGSLHLMVSSCDEFVELQLTNNSQRTSEEMELLSACKLRQLIQIVIELLGNPSPSAFVIAELVKLSRPIFSFLVQICKDESDRNLQSGSVSESVNEWTAAKSSIMQILSRLLNFTESRAARLGLIRYWLELTPTTVVLPHTDSSIVPYPCRPGLYFKTFPFIREMDEKATTFPYTCVIRSPNPRDETLRGHIPHTISSVIGLLDHMAPSSRTKMADADEEGCVPSLRTVSLLAGSTDQGKNLIATLPADVFVSLIEDLNHQVELTVSDMNRPDVVLPNTASFNDAKVTTRTGLTSALLGSAMLETFGDRIWPQDPDQLITLFNMTMERLHLLINRVQETELIEFASETLSQLLGILAFYVQQLGPSSSESTCVQLRDQFSRLLPNMEKLENVLSTRHSLNAQRELLHCLRVSLATRGAVQLSGNERISDVTEAPSDLAVSDVNFEGTQRAPLVEELPDTSTYAPTDLPTESSQPIDPALEAIFTELKDPLLPVRGHGLIELSRLIESRAQCIKDNVDRIFKLLVEHLADEDSYIYLNAIRGLAALGDLRTDSVLSVLADRFRRACIPKPSDRVPSVEFRLKLGETIMRIVRGLGQLAPKYRTLVLHSMSVGCRDNEPLVRAASLSNLCELCRLLQHGIGTIIYELFSLIENHLTQDSSPTVRQAAANLARSLFLENCLPTWLAPDVLWDLNRLLSNRSKVERDPAVLEQIEAALGELSKCARVSLFPKPLSPQDLVKEIRITRPFS